MKKIISFISIIAIMLSMTLTAHAGSIPEDLLHSDEAQIFFAEVVYYHPDKENPDIELSPVKVIKGDVKTGGKLTYYNPNTIGDFKVKEGNVYLFTYFDENNPTDIFDVTSQDTSKLKIKHTTGDMWKRLEQYLNEGKYEKAEQERLDKENNKLVRESGKTLTLSEIIGTDKTVAGTVAVHYTDGLDNKVAEIDRADFFEIADKITCNEIVSTDHINESGFYIVTDVNNAVYISDDGKISRNNPMLSYVAQAEYRLGLEDLTKLKQELIPQENSEESKPIKVFLYIIGFALFGAIIGAAAGFIFYIVRKKRG